MSERHIMRQCQHHTAAATPTLEKNYRYNNLNLLEQNNPGDLHP